MADEKGVALAILGVVAVLSVVGLLMLFRGPTAQVSLGSGRFLEPSAEKACSNIHCENGLGAVVLGDELHGDGEYWVCGCPQNFKDKTIADWSHKWKGDEAQDGLEYGNWDVVWRVRKIREY